MLTEAQVRAALQKAVDAAGGQRAFGRKHEISAAYVGLVLNGDTPSERICAAIGIEKSTTTTYKRTRR